jgi:hypothetical protein
VRSLATLDSKLLVDIDEDCLTREGFQRARDTAPPVHVLVRDEQKEMGRDDR